MKRYCHYHPISPAKWSCSNCRLDFDSACMPDANEKNLSASCPKCKQALTFLNSRLSEQPFWEVTPRFFSAPLQAEPLFLITLIMALSLAFYSHLAITVLSAILSLALVSNYGFQILKLCINGKQSMPGVSAILSASSLKQSLGITILLFTAITSTGLANHVLGTAVSVIIAIVWFWLLPAMLMLSASDDDIRQAFRPDRLLQIIVKIKQAYAGLVAYLILAVISTLIVADFALQHMPSICTPLLTSALASYFSLALFSMYGYALSQLSVLDSRSDANDLNQTATFATTVTDHIKRLDADIDIALKQGEYYTAVSLLEGDMKRHAFSDLRRDQLFKLLTALKDFDRLEHFAQIFLWLMVSRGQVIPAADFIRQLREHNPNFKLYDIELSKVLAEHFHKKGEYPLVIWLAKDAHTRFDPSPELAELYLRAAKTLLEKFAQKSKARSYLSYIIKHLPDQPAAEAAKILEQHILKKRTVE